MSSIGISSRPQPGSSEARGFSGYGADIRLALRLALRELRGGMKGLYVLVACIALGVGAITAVGSLNSALKAGLATSGQLLLGGDIAFTQVQRKAAPEVKTYLSGLGQLSEVVTLRAMARGGGKEGAGGTPVLVEVKGVDAAYPLFGTLGVQGGSATGKRGVLVDQRLALRLGLKSGDHFSLGAARLTIGGILTNEPDLLSGRAVFGPRVIVPMKVLQSTGLLQPGSLMRWHYRLKLSGGHRLDKQGLEAIGRKVKARFPQSSLGMRHRLNPSPGLNRGIGLFSDFLSIVVLVALLIGGLGVANAVAALIERKRKSIAIFRSLGAPGHLPFMIYLLAVLMVTAVGTLIGLLAGTLIPLLVKLFVGHLLPLPFEPGLFPAVWAKAALFGFLVSLLFLLSPLGKSLQIHPGELFRQRSGKNRRLARHPYILGAQLLVLLALVGLMLLTTDTLLMVFAFCAGALILFVLFHLLARWFPKVLRKFPRPSGLSGKLAWANLSGGSALLYPVMMSLGIGLTLIAALVVIRGSILQELGLGLPERAPSFFFLDIGKSEITGFEQLAKRIAPDAILARSPMLRGRLTALNGQPPDMQKAAPRVRWVLRGDRGLTYSPTLPRGSYLTEGQWWPKDYSGPPLVSFEEGAAQGLGLDVGDTVSVNVLGREITARIHNLRKVKWETLSMNFVMVFSPNTLQGAPVKILATLSAPEGAQQPDEVAKREARLLTAIADEFPTVTSVRVRDAIDAVNTIVGNIALAITVAGGLTLLAGALVLAGALAATERQRSYEAVIFKTLGAVRRQIISAHLVEYLAIALVTALIAIGLGATIAYVVITSLMKLDFHLSWSSLLLVLLATVSLVLATGLLNTWRILSLKTSQYLKAE